MWGQYGGNSEDDVNWKMVTKKTCLGPIRWEYRHGVRTLTQLWLLDELTCSGVKSQREVWVTVPTDMESFLKEEEEVS